MGSVKAVCISAERGTQKENIRQAKAILDWGLEGDAHAGHWHRQVSLLAQESIEDFEKRGIVLAPGAFGENLVVEGIALSKLPVGTRLNCGEAVLEITQIGKECHQDCVIRQRTGDCIMPREGVFARVVQEGRISEGDAVSIRPPEKAEGGKREQLTAVVLTISDKGSAGLREDASGPAAGKRLEAAGYRVLERALVPDEKELIMQALVRFADELRADLVLTTGGTGFSLRDVTPEATLAVAERQAPGIAEAIRAGSMRITRRAMLSRGVSAIRGQTLIVNLPGSPKAVEESLDLVLDILEHGILVLKGSATECAGSDVMADRDTGVGHI